MHVSFGTDGVRGVANEAVTVELALALGRAVVRVFDADVVVVGRDTRRSGPALESAVAAGVCAEGAQARVVGVVPTPAVAHACHPAEDGSTTAGVMISASHNPYQDNGLKVFAPGGHKLGDSKQNELSHALDDLLDGSPQPGPTGRAIGMPAEDTEAVRAYTDSLASVLEGRDLSGIRMVLDCANGSNWRLGPEVLRNLGATVEVIGANPDGVNINDGCGSNHPDGLVAAVSGRGADLGIAFDGDADRVVAVDHLGRVVDGDQLIAMCATDLRDRGRLTDDTVVVTVMSNLGFRRAMAEHDIAVLDTAVGDRYVLEALDAGALSLGGEQSGHLVFRDQSTTGDGLLSAVNVIDLVVRSGRPLAELADEAMQRLPQVLVNVPIGAPMPDVAERLAAEVAAVEAELGETGRVLLRPSGTEPLVRVMAEAETHDTAASTAELLAAKVTEAAAATGAAGG